MGLFARIAEPAVIDNREITVAITRTRIALTDTCLQCCRIGLIWRVDIQQRCGIIFYEHRAAPATGVGIVLHIIQIAGMVSVIAFMRQIIAIPLCGTIHLLEESGIVRIAAGIIRAAQTHGRFELEIGRACRGYQMLLLLQHGEQYFLAYATCFCSPVDDLRSCL